MQIEKEQKDEQEKTVVRSVEVQGRASRRVNWQGVKRKGTEGLRPKAASK